MPRYLVTVAGRTFVREGLPAVVVSDERGQRSIAVKFNPHHDRLGRFAAASGGGGGAPLRQVEAEIAHSPIENAVALDRSGAVVLRKSGREADVGFTRKELALLRDTILTHNHPHGSGLNIRDVQVAMAADVRQVRAVTTTHVHALSRPVHGWPVSAEAREAAVAAYWRADRNQQMLFQQRIDAGTLSLEDAERRHHHAVMTHFAREMGWTYKRSPLS